MILKCISAGAIDANCFIICDNTGCGAIIDPGDYDIRISQAIKDAGITDLKYILCTHGHFDHIAGVALFKKQFPNAKIGIGAEDAALLSDTELNLASGFGVAFTPAEADITFSHGDEICVGNIKLKVHSAPGHTPGGVLYEWVDENTLFTGDTLFCGSIGRTDLQGGNFWALMKTLRMFAEFPEEYVIYPGHGPKSTLKNEYGSNPYLRR